jgi:hypothetical protein
MPQFSRWGAAFLVGGVFGAAYLFRIETPAWLVSAMVGVGLLQLWHSALELDAKVQRYPTKKLLAQLFDTKPIDAKHKPSRTIHEGASAPSRITDADREFFADFDMFGTLMNNFDGMLKESPWRLQESSGTELSWGVDAPVYGRHYDVFYNQVCLGHLEISSGPMEYRLDKPDVTTDIELEHVRILPCADVCKFLTTIAHFCWAPTARDYADAQHWINGALLTLAWNNRPSGAAAQARRMAKDLEELPPTLSLHRSGSAAAYLKVRQHHVRLNAPQRTAAAIPA